jgi:hypothetical protein
MGASFLPSTDKGLETWSTNFSNLITANAAIYGLSASDATNFAALLTAYSAALLACVPGIRSKMDVEAKSAAKKNLADEARLLAKRIEGMSSVTNAQKIELGLNVRATPQRIPRPDTAPSTDVESVVGRIVTVRLHGPAGGPRRGKPAGIAGAVLFSYTGSAPPADPNDWKWEGNTTLTKATIEFPESAVPGTVVWVTASWRNERDETGPGSTPVSATIQYASTVAA